MLQVGLPGNILKLKFAHRTLEDVFWGGGGGVDIYTDVKEVRLSRGSNWSALEPHQGLTHPVVTSAARRTLQNCPKLEQGQTTVSKVIRCRQGQHIRKHGSFQPSTVIRKGIPDCEKSAINSQQLEESVLPS